MNRQTLAVTFGTIALLVIGIILLYLTPTPEPNPPASTVSSQIEGKANKTKSKTKAGAGRLPASKLIHRSEIPADRVAAPEGAPNVVVVIASTQRREMWSVYGGPEQTTPFIASQLAEHGVKMSDALSVAVDPHPAAAAITTGRYPHNVGAIEPSAKRNLRRVQGSKLLAERFAESGWYTVGVSASHHFNRKVGQARGFDWYRDSQPFSLMIERRINASQAVRFALNRIGERTDAEKARPLYLQLSFIDSHKPFRVPPSEFSAFENELGVAPYLATIRRIDAAMERLVEGLSAQGITHENTLFVVVADHGEGLELPKHHRKQHGFVLYPSAVQIPWVMWGSGLPAGREVPGLASQIDIAPTVVALAGLKGQDGFDGMDLSAAVLGKAKDTGRTSAYADTLYEGIHRASIWTNTYQCQRDFGSTHKLDDDAFEDGCYDRVSDPEFTKKVADQPELLAELTKQHDALLARAKELAQAPEEADEGEGE
ncbi:MAG TPA: hypothetical protein ENK18_17275 [Deltaproteobacteria bacterium]|nr:hypothetical protein [Deltaproteobacteria bacterium]